MLDLPTFGRPTSATMPLGVVTVIGGGASTSGWLDVALIRATRLHLIEDITDSIQKISRRSLD